MDRGQRPLVIGISGGSGSGKTTFVRRLRQLFDEEELCILSLDNYYKPREEQQCDAEGVKNFDLPESFRREDFLRDVRKLLRGETIEIQEYRYNQPGPKKVLHIRPAPVLVVEGLYALYFLTQAGLCDLQVFIHAHPVSKLVRRVRRDQVERNYPVEDVLYRYERHVFPAYQAYIAPFRDAADIVINNTEHFEGGLRILSGFIRHYLGGLSTED